MIDIERGERRVGDGNRRERPALVEALAARVVALEAALRSLMNEASATFALAEPEIRTAVGNTNAACLLLRITEADALLANAPKREERVSVPFTLA